MVFVDELEGEGLGGAGLVEGDGDGVGFGESWFRGVGQTPDAEGAEVEGLEEFEGVVDAFLGEWGRSVEAF